MFKAQTATSSPVFRDAATKNEERPEAIPTGLFVVRLVD
jgi:hypothetical protein